MNSYPWRLVLHLSTLLLFSLCTGFSSQQASTAPSPTTAPATAHESTERTTPCDVERRAVGTARGSIEKAEACAEAARCVLASQCAAPLSMLLGPGLDDSAELAKSAAEAAAFLQQATQLLDIADGNEERVGALRNCIDRLQPFAEMFAVLADDPSSKDTRQRLLDACISLALLLDEPRAAVVESARLWQAVAYRRAGKPQRALQVLRPVLATPPARTIGLYARIERCRALADRGDYAAALALALRLDRRVEAWFEDRDLQTRRLAGDTIRWVRVDILRAWARQLKKDGMDDRAQDAEEDARLLLGENPYPPSPDQWLILDASIAGVPHCRVSADSQPAEPDDAPESP